MFERSPLEVLASFLICSVIGAASVLGMQAYAKRVRRLAEEGHDAPRS